MQQESEKSTELESYQSFTPDAEVLSNTTIAIPSSAIEEGSQGKNWTFSSETDEDDYSSLDDEIWEARKEMLISKADSFVLPYDAQRGYRATELNVFGFERPHMRAFHASWICFFASFFVQFSQSPLLPVIRSSLGLSKSVIWWSNVWMMIGGIPMRFLLGPLSDKYGARTVMVAVVALAALPAILTGLVVHDGPTLIAIRFLLGAVDSFVPGQYWITCHFVRHVSGTAMALVSGLGASGSAVAQLVFGSVLYPSIKWWLDHVRGMGLNETEETFQNEEAAWRWALALPPSVLALGVAYFFYNYSDDYPLGNYRQVKQAGLVLDRSAVDSFRAGIFNLNSWILFIQFAACCGVDFTMCNGTALYYHSRFHQSTAHAGMISFLYGISAVFARAVGGWVSDSLARHNSLRGRLVAQLLCLVVQGGLNVWFSHVDDLSTSLALLVVWSIVIQMSMGTTYGIVPYVDGPNTGSVAGVVGAGGNLGGAVLAGLFVAMSDDARAMERMGWLTIWAGLLTPLIVVRGYRGLIGGAVDGAEENEGRGEEQKLLPQSSS